jgi:hypothetical protein
MVGSFSMKIEHAMVEWMALKQMLIQYRDESQKRAGTPTLLNLDAIRIYACSEFQNGWSYADTPYQEIVHRILTTSIKSGSGNASNKRSTKWIEETFVPLLRREGLLVQVVNEVENDLFDVWVVNAMMGETGKNCGNCEVLHEIKEYIRKIQERNPA